MAYPKRLKGNERGERWRLAGNELISGVHATEVCTPPCPLHHPTEHHMTPFRIHYRHDRTIFERICDHGIGHPDPDTKYRANDDGTHGCDGCCWSGKRLTMLTVGGPTAS